MLKAPINVATAAAPAQCIASIFVASDCPIIQEGLSSLIGRQRDLRVCGLAADSKTALRGLEANRPDLAIVAGLQGEDTIAALGRLRSRHPTVALLAFCRISEPTYAERALRAGARGYISQSEPTNRIVAAVRRILRGEVAVEDGIAQSLLQYMAKPGLRAATGSIDLLSNREFEVFRWIARGLGTREVADKMCLSVKTVETYRENIKGKLRLRDGHQLLREAILWLDREGG